MNMYVCVHDVAKLAKLRKSRPSASPCSATFILVIIQSVIDVFLTNFLVFFSIFHVCERNKPLLCPVSERALNLQSWCVTSHE